MKIIYLFAFNLLVISLYAQRFNYNNNIFGSSNDASRTVKVDQTGNFIGGGIFRNTVNFSTSFNAVNLASAGGSDAFISKYTPAGDLLWARRIGNNLDDTLLAVASNSVNEVFAIGYFQGTLDVNPGTGTSFLTSSGNASIFISKLDESGNFITGAGFGGTENISVREALVHDSLLIITGSFSGTVDFNPGGGSFSVTSAGVNDAFILLLNQNLQFVNVFTWGGTGNDVVTAITRNNNMFYVAGNYQQSVDFNFDTGQTNSSAASGNSSSFLLKLNSAFGYDSHLSIGSGYTSRISALAGFQNDVWMTVNFSDSLQFGSQINVAEGNSDFILARLDASNTVVWMQQAKGAGISTATGLAVSSSGNILLAGSFSDTLKINNNTQNYIGAQSSRNGFVANFRPDGTFNWILPIVGTGVMQTAQIAAGNTHFVLTGNYSGNLDFDPGIADATYTSNLQDGFFAGYFLNDLNISSVSTTTACGGQIINMQYNIYTEMNGGNQFQVELSNSAGNFTGTQILTNINTTQSGTLNFTVPFNLIESNNYRIRINSTQPSITGLAFPVSFFFKNTPSVNGGNDTTICSGQNITLNAGSNLNYIWTGGIINNVAFQPSQTNVYVVSAIAANGCLSYDSVRITVIQPAAGPAITSSNPNGICSNQVVILSIDSTLQGVLWSNNQTTTSIQIQQAGTYQVSVLDNSGCRSNNSSITLNSLQTPNPPIISVIGTLNLCQGDSVTLNSNVTNNNLWSNGSTSQTITVNTSDTLTVRRRNINSGCFSNPSLPVVVRVFPYAPQPSIITSGNISFCAGQSLTLSSSVSGNNIWNGTITGDSIIVQNSGTYTLTQIDTLNGCNSSTNIQISVLNTPSTPVISGPNSIQLCQGDSVLLQANVGQNLIWSNGLTGNSIYAKTTGNYYVRAIDTITACISDTSNIIQIIVNPAATIPVATASSPTFCAGDSVLLNTDIPGNIVWNNSMTGQFVYIKLQGNFSALYTDSNGCSAVSNIVSVTRFNRPNPPVVTVSGPLTFCQGGSVTLTSNYLNGNFWSNGATTQSTTVNMSDTITVVRINNNTQCISLPSLPVIVTVNPNPATPTIQLIGNQVFCSGDSSLIISDIPGVIWNNNQQADSIYALQSGIYQAVNQNIFGCTAASNTININVNPTPAKPVISSNTGVFNFCENDSILISSNYLFGNQWNTGDTAIIIIASQSFNYTVVHTDSNGCVSPVSDTAFVVRKNNPPQPQIQFSGNLNLCEGDSMLLTSNISGGNNWNLGLTSDSIYAKLGGIYILTQAAGNGCVLGDTVQIVVLPLPLKPSITPNNITTFCEGKKVWLTGPFGAQGYLWNTGDTTRSYIATQSGSYSVQIQDSTGCFSPASDQVIVTVHPLPVFELDSFRICRSESDTLFGPPGMAGYLWSTGASSQNLVVQGSNYAIGPKPFKLNVVDNNGCIYADETTILIDACTGIENISENNKLSLYPNPNNGSFILNLPKIKNYESITVFDLNGRIVFAQDISGQNTDIKLTLSLSRGIYFLQVNNQHSIEKLRFIVH